MRPRDIENGGGALPDTWCLLTNGGPVYAWAERESEDVVIVDAWSIAAVCLVHPFDLGGDERVALAHCVTLVELQGLRVLDVEEPVAMNVSTFNWRRL